MASSLTAWHGGITYPHIIITVYIYIYYITFTFGMWTIASSGFHFRFLKLRKNSRTLCVPTMPNGIYLLIARVETTQSQARHHFR